MFKKKITALLLLAAAIFTITAQSGITVYANSNSDTTEITISGKKDIPDIFSLN